MARLIPITDAKKRDAHVNAENPKRAAANKMVGPNGLPVKLERLIRMTETTSYDALLRANGTPEAVAKAMVDGDPEVDLMLVGRRLGDAARVYLRKDGSIIATARVLQVVCGTDGAEKSRNDFIDVEATVAEDGAPLLWTGRLTPLDEAVRKFAFTRHVQLRHTNGLTFEFLHDMAKTLHEAKKLVYVGSGAKGQGPLIFTTNGAPYRGFLEGRVSGDAYSIVLHLTNLELKSVTGGES